MKIDILHYTAGGAGVIFPAKTFIIEEDTSFIIISPGPLTPDVITKFKNTTKELVFIAPNNFHNLHLKAMYDLFPKAKFYGPKRAAKASGVSLENTKKFSAPNIENIFIQGNSSLSETCFFYKPEKKLIVTDLFFNMNHEMNLMTKLVMKMAGTYKKVATSRIIKFTTDDKLLFKQSLQTLSHLDIDEVIPNHGDSISKEMFDKLLLRERE